MKMGKQCWATEVWELLCKTGFYFVWLQQGIGDVKSFLYVFKQRLLDMFTHVLKSCWHQRQRKIWNVLIFQSYVWSRRIFISYRYIYCFRVALTQLRLGVLPINSNMYRYSDCLTNKNCVLPKPSWKWRSLPFGLSSVHRSTKQIPWTKRYSVIT